MASSFFFLLNSILMGYVWIDGVVFNLLMISINIYRCIPIIQQKLFIKLSQIEEHVYEKCFMKLMDKGTFKSIINCASFIHIASDNYVFQQNNLSNGVYLAVRLNKSHQLSIIVNNEVVDEVDEPYSWFGLIEYDKLNKLKKISTKSPQVNWTNSLKVEKKKNYQENNELNDNDLAFKDYNQPLYVYFFKFEDLDNLHLGENGIFIRNALHSAWLENLSMKIQNIDRKIKKVKTQHHQEIHLSDMMSEGKSGSINEPLLIN